MASVTRVQVEKWNAKMGQDFHLDVRHYVLFGEKDCILQVDQDDGGYIEVRLTYCPEYERKLTMYGKSEHERGVPFEQCNGYNVETGRHIPTAWVQRYHKAETPGLYASFGFGKQKEIGEPSEKKMFSTLQKLTHIVNVEELLPLAK